MNKILKKSLSVFLIIALFAVSVFQINAETVFTADGFSYTVLNDNFASICDWDGGSDTLSVPEKLNSSRVKEIANRTFSGRDDFSCIDFSNADYLDTIGSMAFMDCTSVTGDLSIPAQIKKIKLGAFQGCNSINTLYYNTTASIPEQGFFGCTSLETVSLSDGVTSIGRLAFGKCESLTMIRIPDSVTTINEYAFNECPNMCIHCYRDSYAQQFAKDKGLDFYILDPLYGDSNADGKVNILDVTAIQKYKIGEQELSEYGMRCADVNHDSSITVRDATLIQMKLAKYDVDF